MSGKLGREQCSYINLSSRFEFKADFNSQFFPVYKLRLEQLKPSCMAQATVEWPDVRNHLRGILEVKHYASSVVSGVIVRKYVERPSVIGKYITKIGAIDTMNRPSVKMHYFHEDDEVFLEDETGRIRLDLSGSRRNSAYLVSGVVVAVRGEMGKKPVFKVEDYCFAQAATVPLPVQSRKFIAFVSGLDMGNPNVDPDVYSMLELFLNGSLSEDCEFERSVCRLVILGDSLYKPEDSKKLVRTTLQEEATFNKQTLRTALQDLDTLLASFADQLPVDIMGGESDPTNFSLPQQRMSPYLFPLAAKYSAFTAVSNPYEFSVDGLRVLCTSGQNINNLRYFSPYELDPFEATLKWRHLAPTAPDSLPIVPSTSHDPFVIQTLPHLYVAGNQPSFTVGQVEGIVTVSVPRFSDEQVVVLVDCETLQVRRLNIASA
jgi:DNA polymerase delta subunit 2